MVKLKAVIVELNLRKKRPKKTRKDQNNVIAVIFGRWADHFALRWKAVERCGLTWYCVWSGRVEGLHSWPLTRFVVDQDAPLQMSGTASLKHRWADVPWRLTRRGHSCKGSAWNAALEMYPVYKYVYCYQGDETIQPSISCQEQHGFQGIGYRQRFWMLESWGIALGGALWVRVPVILRGIILERWGRKTLKQPYSLVLPSLYNKVWQVIPSLKALFIGFVDLLVCPGLKTIWLCLREGKDLERVTLERDLRRFTCNRSSFETNTVWVSSQHLINPFSRSTLSLWSK